MRAFVFSGGGALGAFELGVLNQLDKKGIKPDLVIGTSTGALNATGYAYKGIAYLNQVWRGIKGSTDVFKSRGLLIPFYLLFGSGKGVYSAKPLQKIIEKTVDYQQPNIPVGVCRVSLNTTEAQYIFARPSQVNNTILMRKATLASASTPIYNDVVDNEFVDGGVRHIAPLGEAIDEGADEIYVILCEQFEQNQKSNYTGAIGNVIKVFNYTINALVQGVLWNDVRMCQRINSLVSAAGVNAGPYKHVNLHVYAPKKDIGSSTDFTPKHIADLIAYGESIDPVM